MEQIFCVARGKVRDNKWPSVNKFPRHDVDEQKKAYKTEHGQLLWTELEEAIISLVCFVYFDI